MIGGETHDPPDRTPDDDTKCGYCRHPYAEHCEPVGCEFEAINDELINGKPFVRYGCDCTAFVLPDGPADNEPTSREEMEQI